MVKNKIINSDYPKLKKAFQNDLPEIVKMAEESADRFAFQQKLENYLKEQRVQREEQHKHVEAVLTLLENEGKVIDELSTGQQMQIHTILWLWQFLTSTVTGEVSTDLLIDLYHLLRQVKQPITVRPDRNLVRRQMNRWPSGLDKEVIAIRERNKTRIITNLIRRIDRHHSPQSRYHFEEGLTYEQKYQQVEEWWKIPRFHLSMAIKSPTELNNFLGNSLPEEIMLQLLRARKKGMPFFVTPYYLSLLNIEEKGYDDETIRSYVLYSKELVETYGNIRAWEREDLVEPGKPNAAGWLLPEGHNIHRRYPEVDILIPDSMGRACGGLCASCKRMY
ncbi:MAG: KamA family protein, partial [Tannerellaceae bacterium]|nr:KamA family protein [Tannerellaceae bacterium]